VAAEIVNAAGPVASVEVLVDGIRSEVPNSFQPGFPYTYPYSLWIPANLGAHRLQAAVVERSGNRLLSEAVTVIVAKAQAPALTILSPTNAAHFSPRSVITVERVRYGPDYLMGWARRLAPLPDQRAADPDWRFTNWYTGDRASHGQPATARRKRKNL
jgi:hypothetical protein